MSFIFTSYLSNKYPLWDWRAILKSLFDHYGPYIPFESNGKFFLTSAKEDNFCFGFREAGGVKRKMSSFSDSNFVKKLGELNNTQQSIQTLSLWLIHHRKHSKTIVQVWLREMQRGRSKLVCQHFCCCLQHMEC